MQKLVLYQLLKLRLDRFLPNTTFLWGYLPQMEGSMGANHHLGECFEVFGEKFGKISLFQVGRLLETQTDRIEVWLRIVQFTILRQIGQPTESELVFRTGQYEI